MMSDSGDFAHGLESEDSCLPLSARDSGRAGARFAATETQARLLSWARRRLTRGRSRCDRHFVGQRCADESLAVCLVAGANRPFRVPVLRRQVFVIHRGGGAWRSVCWWALIRAACASLRDERRSMRVQATPRSVCDFRACVPLVSRRPGSRRALLGVASRRSVSETRCQRCAELWFESAGCPVGHTLRIPLLVR